MKNSLVWISKQILRTAFVILIFYTFSQPPGHTLDFIPHWLSMGLVLGLFWPVYKRLIKNIYSSIADDIAGRVAKRISTELHDVQYEMDAKSPALADMLGRE